MGRVEKVAEEIRKEVSCIVHDDLKDPRLGFVTITQIEMAKDLRFAKIYFSVLGNEEEYAKTKKALDSALGYIRKLIGERMQLRFVPEILFKEDRAGEYSSRIEQILNEIKGETQPVFNLKMRVKAKRRKRGHSEPRKSSRLRKKK